MSDSTELRRLRWRCRRGVLELDLILARFMAETYPGLGVPERVVFERLLELPDSTLLACIQGRQDVGDEELRNLVRKF